MGLVKTFLQIAVTLSLAVFISTPSVADRAVASDCTKAWATNCNNIAGCLDQEGECGICPSGYYCPAQLLIDKEAKKCPANYYCLGGNKTGYENSCPSTYPNSDLGSDAISDCYFNIPAGYEYDDSGTNIACHAGGYCPGVKIYYNNAKIDEWGWASCNNSDKISGANGRTTSSLSGADGPADCYVICPTEQIPNGTKNEHIISATTSSNGTYYYPACNYSSRITCNTGYELNSSKNGCKAKTTTVSFDKNGGSGGDVSVTATYDADMPKITSPTRTGFTFNGYYYQSIKYYDTNGNSVRKWDQTTGNITLTASWTANTYNITYDTNDGAFSAAATNHPATARYNQMFYVDHPTRKNYEFAGWKITDMSDGIKHYYGDYSTTSNTIDKTTETAYKNLHHQSGATVKFTAQWSGKYYEVTLNDTCPDGAAHPTTCKSGTQTVACSVSPENIYEQYNTGWFVWGNSEYTAFSQLTRLPVCNKYKFKGFVKGVDETINSAGALKSNLSKTLFSDDDLGGRTEPQFTAVYDACTCSASTGVQSCVASSTTAENKCVFTVTCKTGYSKDGENGVDTTYLVTDDDNSYTATCQAITYGFKIDKNGGTGGNLPTGTIEIKYDDTLDNASKDLSTFDVPCKAGYVITGLEDKKDSVGTRYYTYDAGTKALAAVSGKKWDKTENPTTLYVKYDACGGEGAGKNNTYCDCSNSKRNEKQNCPALFQSEEPADAKTDCYMTGKINLSDKFGTTELNLDSLKLYLQQ